MKKVVTKDTGASKGVWRGGFMGAEFPLDQ